MKNIVLTIALCLVALATPASAGITVLTAAKVAEVYAREPIPAQYDPRTHAMPSNYLTRYVHHAKFRANCHFIKFGCEVGPNGHNSLTFHYVFIDLDAVPPALRPAVLRHEQAHVLGWRH